MQNISCTSSLFRIKIQLDKEFDNTSPSPNGGTLAFDDKVYLVSGPNGMPYVYAYEIFENFTHPFQSEAIQLWNISTNSLVTSRIGTGFDDTLTYFIESKGVIVCVETRTGVEQWRYEVGDDINADFEIIDDAFLAFATSNGSISLLIIGETPTDTPSLAPSTIPSTITAKPSQVPSSSPSIIPTERFSLRPSNNPTILESLRPSTYPTTNPTTIPSPYGTEVPSTYPTSNPTTIPSASGTDLPTVGYTTENPSASPLHQDAGIDPQSIGNEDVLIHSSSIRQKINTLVIACCLVFTLML